MKGAFLTAAAAALLVAAPALAQEVTIEKKETTITREVPESGSTVSTVVVAPNPPPELRVETPPLPPGPAMVWIGGNWRWSPETRDYTWAGGRYAEPPRPRAAWVPGHWVQRPDGWVFVDGRWD